MEELEDPGKGFWEESEFILDEADLFLGETTILARAEFHRHSSPSKRQEFASNTICGKVSENTSTTHVAFYIKTHNQSP